MSAVSMEQFGPISVDYFHGRRVERVEPQDTSLDGPTWIMYLASGGEIHNFDLEVPTPTQVVGAALTRTIFDGKKKVTRLQFGLEEITINPMKYAIRDPNYTKGQLVYPQASLANIPLPEEPEGREADGPDADWQPEEPADEQS